MSTLERRNTLYRKIQTGADQVAVNGASFANWLIDNLEDVIRQDVFLELDTIVMLYGYAAAIGLADRRGGDDPEQYEGQIWQAVNVEVGRQSRAWLEHHREKFINMQRDARTAQHNPALARAIRDAFPDYDFGPDPELKIGGGDRA